jgi:hypothetical protein
MKSDPGQITYGKKHTGEAEKIAIGKPLIELCIKA